MSTTTTTTTTDHGSKFGKGRITFLANDASYKTEKPCLFVPPTKPTLRNGVNPPKVQKDVRDQEVENVRAWKDELDLEKHGFVVLKHKTQHPELDDLAECDAYKAETADMLKGLMKAEQVMTWNVRKRMPNKRAKDATWDFHNPTEIEQPALMVHCDFSYARGYVRVEHFLGKEEMEKLLATGHRIRIMNTWRPLVPVIERQPLAICDPRSVDAQDLIACDRVVVDDVSEIYLLQHRQGQRWYWLESQTMEEPFLFTTWDSKYPGQSKNSPHVAFDVDVREDAPPRLSVETRSIVITKE